MSPRYFFIFCYAFLHVSTTQGIFRSETGDCSTGSTGIVTMSPEFLTAAVTSLPSSTPGACNIPNGQCDSPPMACNSTCCLSGSNDETQACGCFPEKPHSSGITCNDPKRLLAFAENCPADSTDDQHQVKVEIAQVPSTTPCETIKDTQIILMSDGRLKCTYTTVHCFRQQGSLPELEGNVLKHQVIQTKMTNTGFFYVDHLDCAAKNTVGWTP